MRQAEEASFVRGWVITAITIAAPLVLSAVAFAVSETLRLEWLFLPAGVTFMWWACLVFPYWFVTPAIVSLPIALLLAAVHWIVVALLVAILTRRLRFHTMVLVALSAVIGTGGAVLGMLRVFGYRPDFLHK